jgi:N-acyl homoserine lactone hydrolase
VTAAVVQPLLLGYGMSSDQGSIGFGAVYLVRAGGRCAVFDTGPTGRRRALLRALARHGLEPADVDVVVLSHAHYDHVQNTDLFRRAEVLLHPAESRILAAADPADPFCPPWSQAVLAGLAVRPALDGAQVLPGVRVLGLPGHTEGSVGLRVETAEGVAVLTGDAVSSAAALRAGRCTRVEFGAAAATASLRLVADVADQVFPGHDRPFRVRAGRPAEYLAPPVELSVRVAKES